MATCTNFWKNIFINCPFDNDYKPLLWCLLFTITYCELEAKIASNRLDSAEIRFEKIKDLIQESAYSIHDISRMEPIKKDELPRFNMPFELGVDFGCREYGNIEHREKKFLVLDEKPYRYQKALSDLSGHDFESHKSDPETLTRKVRNWIWNNINNSIPSGNTIWRDYNEFYDDFITATSEQGYSEADIQDMPVAEVIFFMKEWRFSRT